MLCFEQIILICHSLSYLFLGQVLVGLLVPLLLLPAVLAFRYL